MVVAGKRKIVMPVPNSNTKKAKQKQSNESEEEEESSESEEEESSESEEEEEPSMDMPQTGHKISKLKCEETKGRARVWWAFFCEPEYRQWCKLSRCCTKRACAKESSGGLQTQPREGAEFG